MPKIVQCPACSSKLRLPDDAKKSRCPKCTHVFEIKSTAAGPSKGPVKAKPVKASVVQPSPSRTRSANVRPQNPAPSQPAPSQPAKNVRCPDCQATLKIAASAIGKKIRCPKCSKTFTAGAPKQEQIASPVQEPLETFEPFGGDDLFSSLPSESANQIPELGNFGLDSTSPELYPPASPPEYGGGYQPYAPPPQSRVKKRKRSDGDWKSWLTEPQQLLMLVGIVAVASFFLSAIPLLGWVVCLLVLVAYVAIQMVGGIWLIVIAFEEDIAQGLLYLFLPFYALFYLITRWDKCRVPFMMCIVSLLSLVCSFAGMLIGTVILGMIVGPQR